LLTGSAGVSPASFPEKSGRNARAPSGDLRWILILLVSGLALSGCNASKEDPPAATAAAKPAGDPFPVKIEPRWAELYKVAYRGGFAEVSLRAPWQSEGEAMRYRLRPRGTPAPPAEDGLREVEVPLRSVATTSTTELPALVALGVESTWVGHSENDFVSSPVLRERIEAGAVKEIGSPTQLETLLALHPDALFADFLSKPELDRLALAEKAGTPILMVPSFLETAPLGRAEWVLPISLFFGREREAVAYFDAIEKRYLELRDRVAAAKVDRPKVFTGGPYQNVWHVPGGRSFAARLLADAGAAYVWQDDPAGGAVALDLEKVFERAQEADFWIYPSHWRSLREIAAVDPRLALFAAFRNGKVIAGDLRLSPNGGNDFWEEGAARPDLVLEDIVSLIHPELLPGHQQRYHRLLANEAP
jgi:iron complex transport system substrate-binding protein